MDFHKQDFNIIGIIANRKIGEQKRLLLQLTTYLKKNKKKILLDKNSHLVLKEKTYFHKEDILKKADLVIALGGDGTVLKTARVVSKEKFTPVLPVNLGNLGFLTEVSPKKLIQYLDKIFFKKNYVLDGRELLRITVYREGEKIFTSVALNDAVINQGNFARLITLRMEIDQRKVTRIRADGLIIATPTGSTAHSLSAHGPIVHPQVKALIINPICPAGLGNRTIIIPNEKQIKIIIETLRRDEDTASEIGLTLDGQVIFPLKYGDEIKIRKSTRKFYMIRLGGKRYYKVLRDKLGWGN